ncbi:MAG: GTPase Era [Candidatus Sumerlaeota bacterium]|nr:GTPase Era [Candidatus Sumerlaeota bacterium]
MSESLPHFKAGMIAIVGVPNVGKSTFLNRALGCKLAIVSPKPQTTRDKIAGILTEDASQIVFLDTPGLVAPRDLLHEALVARVRESLHGVDGVLHLRDSTEPNLQDDPAAELLAHSRAPLVEAWNKIDLLSSPQRRALDAALSRRPPGAAFAVSALTGEGLPTLLEALRALLPEGPPLYSPDDLSDRDLRFFAAEAVRERIFELARHEVPYSVATQTEEFIERPNGKHYVRVLIYVEHESQKGILIGQGGELLKRIGQAARREIEDLADHPVYLELHVKVRKNWTKKPGDLKEFGYRLPCGERSRAARGPRRGPGEGGPRSPSGGGAS